MKLLVVPKDKNILKYTDYVDGFIVALKYYSVTYDFKMSIEEIKKLKESTSNEIFVVINKPIFNSEIEDLEHVLMELSDIGINGIFFYDLSILSIVKRLHLDINLIWNQTHMVTNYNTCNYYKKQGVYGALLANEITLKEMIEIKKNSDIKVYANVIYRPVMSFTRRSLLTNYFKSMGKEIKSNSLDIYEKVTGKNFLVKEEKDGTSIIYSNIVNGIEPLFEMIDNNFDYGIVDMTYIDDDEVLKIVSHSLHYDCVDRDSVISRVNNLIGTDTGFFYKETVYKVKGTQYKN